jgi:hypothetical protein
MNSTASWLLIAAAVYCVYSLVKKARMLRDLLWSFRQANRRRDDYYRKTWRDMALGIVIDISVLYIVASILSTL